MIYFIIIYAIIGLFFFLLSRHFSIMQGDWGSKKHRRVATGLSVLWPVWVLAAIIRHIIVRRRERRLLNGKE